MDYLDDWNERQTVLAREIRRQRATVARKLADVEVRANAADGSAGVVVDANGRVVEIRLAPLGLRLGAPGLSLTLTKLLQRAQAEAAARTERIAEEFAASAGAGDAVALVRAILGDEPSESPPAPAQRVDDDTYFERFHEDPLGRQR